MVIYARLLWFAAGLTVCQRLIFIHPKHRDNLALLVHERTHQAQMARVGTLTFWRRYLTSKAFRQACEVEAYKVQIAHGASITSCAMHLSRDYWLGITKDEAYALLTN